jgi:hypothetical protein
MTTVREALVELHREAYQHRGSPFAETLIAAEDENLTADERLSLLGGVAAELEARIIVSEAEIDVIRGHL